MHIYRYLLAIILMGFSIFSFSQSEEKKFKKAWNNMLARFNVLYHSQLALDDAVLNKYKTHKDDFETLIGIYPYPSEENSKGMAGSMEEIMKRVSKIIQERPKSKWVDDAFLIIAQTHFYGFEMFKAIDAFQYIYNEYDDPDVRLKAQIWLIKSYMRDGKPDDAEALLGMLLEEQEGKKLSNENNALLYLSAADLMVSLNKYSAALDYIKKGVSSEKVRYLKYRSHFLAGQINLQQGFFDKAAKEFHKVNKLNAPYEYVFQANIGIVNAARKEGSEKNLRLAKRELKQMLRDDKNIDYFDQIYFELAKLEFESDHPKEGLVYLQESAKYSGANMNQKTKTYLYLADYYFNNRTFVKAQAYYDSTIAVMPETYPDYEKINKKHVVLSRLIDGLNEIHHQDSLLKLAELPKDKLDAKIRKIFENDQELERIRKEDEEIRMQQDLLDAQNKRTPVANNVSGEWYFYNTNAMAQGSAEWGRLWGNRQHEHWWRFLNVKKDVVASFENDDPDDETDDLFEMDEDPDKVELLADVDESLKKYYTDLPLTPLSKLSANRKVEKAHFAVGKIYFEDLKEPVKSQPYLETLLKRYPQTEYESEALFFLVKIFQVLDKEDKANDLLDILGQKYPNSSFYKVLTNEEIVETGTDQKVLKLYESMYAAYIDEDYSTASNLYQKALKEFSGNTIQGKFDLLNAFLTGRLKGLEAYMQDLESISNNYSGTEIGQKAKDLLEVLQKNNSDIVESSLYDKSTAGDHYFVLSGKTSSSDKILIQLNSYNAEFFPKESFQTKIITKGEREIFYTLPFGSDLKVKRYYKEMKSALKFFQEAGLEEIEIYPITTANFKILINQPSEVEYLDFVKTKYN